MQYQNTTDIAVCLANHVKNKIYEETSISTLYADGNYL